MAGGWRLVRWVGGPAAFQDPYILRKIGRGEMSVGTLEALRRYEYHLRVSLSPGSERVLGPGHAGGFSRTYRFVPATRENPSGPFQWMTPEDAALLLGNRWERWSFVDVTDAPVKDRAPMRPQDWPALLADYAMLTTGTGDPLAGREVLGSQLARPYR